MQKLSRNLTVLALLVLLVPACTYESPEQESWEEGGVDCGNNSNPALGTWRVNSTRAILDDGSLSETQWLLGSNFSWRDPFPTATNEDPPNMIGGWISTHIEDTELVNHPYIDSDWLESGCRDGQSTQCAALGFANAGYTTDCGTGPSAENCNCSGNRCGSLTFVVTGEEGLFIEGRAFHMTLRIRDRCGAASKQRDTYTRGRYVIGSGLVDVSAETSAILDTLDPS